ncbi:putative delta-aminolevulinic acid dehydratase [Babesia sp. Xinjiang]|uniref:putative delta-aminolevulinic acid dehydratase n=1 Tax=Babesia sp. Xinjiang TaxID=462227 RepID=UPI000A24885A|nr:putative delta-aminolevulinic acid dehydratase [Babesia sp. Xinjiang]ORM41514.1 putative delta-aminolevulinic acid dehydratase [Babesia sp. Xinjiang]
MDGSDNPRASSFGKVLAKTKEEESTDTATDDLETAELDSEVDYEDIYDESEYETDDEDGSESEYDSDEAGNSAFDYNARGELMLPNLSRLSRTRVSRNRHKLFRGRVLHLSDLVYPLVAHDKESSMSVPDLPGLRLLSIPDLVKEIEEARNLGLTAFMIHPHVDKSLRSEFADEGLNPDGLLPRAINAVKEAFPDVQVFADASVAHFSLDGHDGLVEPETDSIANDVSVSQVAKQVTTLASAGCDVVGLNDTLDGSVGVARDALDFEGFTDVSLMSRAAKFNSVLMQQQRALLGVAPSDNVRPETYLHDVALPDEPILKGVQDVDDGADMVAVEPATTFVDVIRNLKDRLRTPVVAFHTTGEYRALKAAAAAGVFDERAAALETLRGLRRAGADVIISSFSKDVAQWLLEDMQTNGMENRSELLPENPHIVRGRLDNGLEYTLLPNSNHCDRFEAYLEVLSGSADELEHQRGIAHFCEHVTYMGSRKRDCLVGRDVRTNAFTDFHHTVFYASCPSVMDGCSGKGESLERALSALVDVVEAPTQFSTSRVEKERQAILSEARIINTLEYRKNCATVQALHAETRLSRRFPIGDLARLGEYTVNDLLDYHRVHYRPSNLRLFVVGDLDVSDAEYSIRRIFSGMKEHTDEVDRHLKLNADIYRGTVKETRRGLPPARHEWDQPGPKAHVWQNDQIKNLSLEIAKKIPIPTMLNRTDIWKSVVMKLAYRILTLNFDILQRGTGAIESVETNDYDCTNEGCRVRSFELHCVPYQWRAALTAAIAQVKCLATQGTTPELFKIVKESMLHDCARSDTTKSENRDLISGLMEATTCGRTLMLPEVEKEIVVDILSRVHIDDVNEMAYKLFPWASGKNFVGINLICSTPPPDPSIGFDGVGEELILDAFEKECKEPLTASALHPEVNTPSKLLTDEERSEVINSRPYGHDPGFVNDPMLPKERYACLQESKEELLRSLAVVGDLKHVATRYVDSLRDSISCRSDVEHISENKPAPPEFSKLSEHLVNHSRHSPDQSYVGRYTNALAELRKPLASTLPPDSLLYESRPGPSGIHLLTLNNSIRVNLHVGDEDQLAIKAIIPVEYDYSNLASLRRRKLELLLAATTMMEGGAMGSLSRLQVEMFCTQHLMDVQISANEDYFSIEMSFPYGCTGRRENNLESALQILYAVLQYHKLEPDAFVRAKEKLRRDRNAYAQDLQSFGTGDLVSSMSDGKLSYHDLDYDALGSATLADVQGTFDGIFKRGVVEVSLSGAVDIREAKSLLVQYLGTIQLPEYSTAPRDRFVLWSKDYGVDVAVGSPDAVGLDDLGAGHPSIDPQGQVESTTTTVSDENSEENFVPLENQHRLILVPDNQERAMVLLGGYAPNASGIMPDGTHMADMLHLSLSEAMECDVNAQNAEKLIRTVKELWLHPAFPRAACALIQEILTNRAFTVLRAEKHLTYESNVDFVLYDVQFAGYFVISVHSSFDKSEAILAETRRVLADIRSGDRPILEQHLIRARDQVLARLRKDRTTNRHWIGELLGMQSRRLPLKNSLFTTEFDRVLQRVTLDDIQLLFSSDVFGFDEKHLWSRIVHTTVA